MALVDAMSLTWLLLMLLVMVVLELLSSRGSLACPAAGGSSGAVAAVICDVLEAEASDQADLASWVANIRPAADEMATHIADMPMHMGGDQPGRFPQRALLSGKRLVARHAGVGA